MMDDANSSVIGEPVDKQPAPGHNSHHYIGVENTNLEQTYLLQKDKQTDEKNGLKDHKKRTNHKQKKKSSEQRKLEYADHGNGCDCQCCNEFCRNCPDYCGACVGCIILLICCVEEH